MSNRVTADMTPAEAAAVATRVDSDEWTVFEDHLFVACCDCGLAHRVEVRQHNVGQRAIRFIRLDEFSAEIRKRQQAEHATHESRSAGNGGEPKACTPAEERGIVGATGAGQLPAMTAENRDSAERRSPDGTASTPSLDESNQHLVEMRLLLSSAAGLITLATDLKPISEWQRDVVFRAEAWLRDYYRTINHA